MTVTKRSIQRLFMKNVIRLTSVVLIGFSSITGAEVSEDQWPAFLEQLKQQSLAAGIKQQTIDNVWPDLQLIPKVVSQDRSQPSRDKLTVEAYLQRVITPTRIEQGRKKYRENYQQINAIARDIGVEAKYLVALWGVESSYGRLLGKHHVPSALATMAYEGRRREFFSKEFIDALRIIEQGHISSKEMKGSWAGAMGQCQFMPSSFLRFARDGDGDGRADIWSNMADVMASSANYLRLNGWRAGEHWGRQVVVPDHQQFISFNNQKKNLNQWQALGVRRDDGSNLPVAEMNARLRIDENPAERVFLLYHNYDVFLRWNRSEFFATSVGYLADRIAFPPVMNTPQPDSLEVAAEPAP